MAKAKKAEQPKVQKHILTEQDFANNPDLEAQGLKVGDEINLIDDPENQEQTVSDNIKALFEKHPHLLTIWVNKDQTEWYFREMPGFTPIERNEVEL